MKTRKQSSEDACTSTPTEAAEDLGATWASSEDPRLLMPAEVLVNLGYDGICKNPLNRARAMCAALAAVKADSDSRDPSAALAALSSAVGFQAQRHAAPTPVYSASGVEVGYMPTLRSEVKMLALPDGSAVCAKQKTWTAVVEWVEEWYKEYHPTRAANTPNGAG